MIVLTFVIEDEVTTVLPSASMVTVSFLVEEDPVTTVSSPEAKYVAKPETLRVIFAPFITLSPSSIFTVEAFA